MDELIKCLQSNSTYRLKTDCTQYADYIYIDDCVNALLLPLKYRMPGGIYNVGNGEAHSLRYYFEKVKMLIPSKGTIIYGAYKDETGFDFIYDASKLKSCMGWEANISFEEGIKRMLVSSV